MTSMSDPILLDWLCMAGRLLRAGVLQGPHQEAVREELHAPQ